jgi:hypothetical protein
VPEASVVSKEMPRLRELSSPNWMPAAAESAPSATLALSRAAAMSSLACLRGSS